MLEPRLHFPHDFRNPNYTAVFQHRINTLAAIKKDAGLLRAFKAFYRENPVQFVIDWGCTTDPRNVSQGLPAVLPFLMFPKQIEFAQWILDRWHGNEPGIAEKSRDVGMSWIAIGLSCSLCLHMEGVVIGFGSRKEEYVDKLDSPKSLFWKARKFMQLIPPEFKDGWNERTDAPHMRIKFPHTGSVMTGEAGDGIGRGDRTSLYIVDEAAHLERPDLVDASLSATTNCRIDVSSVAGMTNSFATRRHSGKIKVFTFSWRDDPRKDEAWYAKQVNDLPATVVAQEIDINYTASVLGIVIPQAWVQAAVDAHVKLGFKATGRRRGALDVADEGDDALAFAGAHGVVIEYVEQWTGKGADIYDSVEKSHAICMSQGYDAYRYDADGLGAGVRGDSRKVNEAAPYTHEDHGPVGKAEATPFRGSAKVVNPDKPIPTADSGAGRDATERTNEDFFANYKAQSWWDLRVRFQRTYRAVTEGHKYDPDQLISLSSRIPCLAALCIELSQPTYTTNGAGKVLINKQPDGSKSPNLADAVMIVSAPGVVRSSLFDT